MGSIFSASFVFFFLNDKVPANPMPSEHARVVHVFDTLFVFFLLFGLGMPQKKKKKNSGTLLPYTTRRMIYCIGNQLSRVPIGLLLCPNILFAEEKRKKKNAGGGLCVCGFVCVFVRVLLSSTSFVPPPPAALYVSDRVKWLNCCRGSRRSESKQAVAPSLQYFAPFIPAALTLRNMYTKGRNDMMACLACGCSRPALNDA